MFFSNLMPKFPELSDGNKSKYLAGLSIATGVTSIVLNLFTFGIAGSLLSLVSIISALGSAYYKGKEAKFNELNNNNSIEMTEKRKIHLPKGTDNTYRI